MKVFPERKERCAFWLLIWRQGFPTGAANRAEQDCIGCLTSCQRLRRKSLPDRINGRSTDKTFAQLVIKTVPSSNASERFDGFSHYFRTYSVPREHSDF
jgi:hypothetical protein